MLARADERSQRIHLSHRAFRTSSKRVRSLERQSEGTPGIGETIHQALGLRPNPDHLRTALVDAERAECPFDGVKLRRENFDIPHDCRKLSRGGYCVSAEALEIGLVAGANRVA